MRFCVYIRDLEFRAIVGVLESEREKKQDIILHAKIFYDYAQQSEDAHSVGFLDYAEVVKVIKHHIKSKKYGLLEDLLLGLNAILRKKFPMIKKMYLQAFKPSAIKGAQVGLGLKSNTKSLLAFFA